MYVQNESHWYQKKGITIPLALVILLLIGLRLALPGIILREANKLGGTVSPLYSAHIDDVHVALIRGAFDLDGVTVKLKKDGREFLRVKSIDTSVAWRELFHGRLLLDVGLDALNLIVAKDLVDSFSSLKNDASKQESRLPVKITRVSLENSRITFKDYPGVGEDKFLTVNEINGYLTNAKPSTADPVSHFDFTASPARDSHLHLFGKLEPLKKTKDWDLDAELKHFDLSKLNKTLMEKLPMSFKKGTLDLYAEVRSKKSEVKGYIKPFLEHVEAMGNKSDFKGPKQFLFEAVEEVANLVLKNDKNQTVATKIPFNWNQKDGLKVDTGEATKKVLKYEDKPEKVKKGFDHDVRI